MLFEIGENEHEVLRGVTRLTIANVSSVNGLPGSTQLVRLNQLKLMRPTSPGLRYDQDGWLTVAAVCDLFDAPSWSAALVEAPKELTGRGRVLACGSWDLVGPDGTYLKRGDNRKFIENLVTWLAS